MEYLDSGHNWILRVLDPFIFWTMQFTFAIEAWRRQFGPAIGTWLAALGEIEALSSLAGYAYENPEDVFPEFADHAPVFDATGFTHPLLPRAHAVRNDLALSHQLQLIIISGPNMAGKSTFVRAVGVNAVLAQCGAPVRAQKSGDVTSGGERLHLRTRFAARRRLALLCGDHAAEADCRSGQGAGARFVLAG